MELSPEPVPTPEEMRAKMRAILADMHRCLQPEREAAEEPRASAPARPRRAAARRNARKAG